MPREGKPQPTTLKFNSIDEQATWLAKNVLMTETQARALLDEAFKKDTSVVIGGSQVRGDYTKSSDLDVGYGSLSKAKAQRINDKISDVGPLRISRTPIIPGFESKTVPKIESPRSSSNGQVFVAPTIRKSQGSHLRRPGGLRCKERRNRHNIRGCRSSAALTEGLWLPSEAIDYRDVRIWRASGRTSILVQHSMHEGRINRPFATSL